MDIKGVLFDKDGTLLEFHQMWISVSQSVVGVLLARDSTQAMISDESLLAAIGVYGDRVDNHGLLASNPVEDIALTWFEMLMPGCSKADFIDDVKSLFNQTVKENPGLIKSLPGIEAVLITLKQCGLKLGIATADSKAATLYSLEQAGLLDYFDFIGYSDGDIEPKPAPDLMEAFCATCGLIARQVVMFGDTVSDMKFGQNAGAISIGVLTGTATHAELAPHARMVISSVADFTPGLLDRMRHSPTTPQ